MYGKSNSVSLLRHALNLMTQLRGYLFLTFFQTIFTIQKQHRIEVHVIGLNRTQILWWVLKILATVINSQLHHLYHQ